MSLPLLRRLGPALLLFILLASSLAGCLGSKGGDASPTPTTTTPPPPPTTTAATTPPPACPGDEAAQVRQLKLDAKQPALAPGDTNYPVNVTVRAVDDANGEHWFCGRLHVLLEERSGASPSYTYTKVGDWAYGVGRGDWSNPSAYATTYWRHYHVIDHTWFKDKTNYRITIVADLYATGTLVEGSAVHYYLK